MGARAACQERMRRQSWGAPTARAVGLATVAAALAVVAVDVGPACAALADTAKVSAMVLVLDASGSMKESDGHGSTKIADAKAALKTIIGQLPADLQVGLMAYGHRVASTPDHAKACKDVQLVSPVAPLDKAALTAAVGAFAAKGETPIGLSLQQAAAALPTGSAGSVVLISDGQDSCAPPEPCAVAKQLKATGVQLTVDTVGLKVNSAARSQLTCISQATGGSYTDVQDAAKLADSLGKVTATRAPRTGALTGQAVEGAPAPEQAPKVAPGTYTDTIQKGETLYYGIDVAAGQSIEVRSTLDARNHQGNGGLFTLSLVTIGGDSLGEESHTFYEKKLDRVSVKTRSPVKEAGTIYLSMDASGSLNAGEQMPYTFQVLVTGAGADASPTDSGAGTAAGGAASSAAPQPTATGTAPVAGPATPAVAPTGFLHRQFELPVVAGVGGGGLVGGMVIGSILTVMAGRRRRQRQGPDSTPTALIGTGRPFGAPPGPGGPGGAPGGMPTGMPPVGSPQPGYGGGHGAGFGDDRTTMPPPRY